MKRRFLLFASTLLFSACTSQTPPQGSPMMHGGMQHGMTDGNQGMMGNQAQTAGFLPGQGEDLSSLPEAKVSSVLDIGDGQMTSLNPTLVHKTIGGKEIAMYGYNSQIPGPLLRVKQGSTFTVNVTNKIDLPTSIHWHGLRLDNANDGAVGVTQNAIEPGESFAYAVKVPDEGLYWYHTHVREDVQQPMGLYGAILVTPEKTITHSWEDRDEVIILNDLLLDANKMPVPYGRENADHTLMGRFGNTFLVNGAEPRPVEVGLGSIVRFSFLNASNTRPYRIVQPDGSLLKIIGADNGRYEREYMTDSYTLSPSERLIAEVYFWDDAVNRGAPERTVTLVESGPPSHPTPVVTATIIGGVIGIDDLPEFQVLRENEDVREDINTFRPFFNKPIDHTLLLDMGMMSSTGSPQVGGMGGGMMMGGVPPDGIEWEDSAMNAMPMGNMMQWKLVDEATGAANDKLVYTAKVGDKMKIRIVNKANSPHPMQHPIHFHGQRFLVLSDNGVETENFVWKDTTLVRAGHTVDILLDISNPGDWMFHCHIAEHLSNGMMGMLKVRE